MISAEEYFKGDLVKRPLIDVSKVKDEEEPKDFGSVISEEESKTWRSERLKGSNGKVFIIPTL